MADLIEIDGSQGEGGGQIVRSSLSLAAVTGRPVRIDRIRAGREKPGLMRQHLTAASAVTEICGGQLEGARIGAHSITFYPGRVRPGDYQFSVGTAGSATLVLQTVLPALLTASGPSRLALEGGTHNPWAPPFDFLAQAYLPLVNRMGPRVEVQLERYGFYPAGGGRITVTIEPAAALAGFDLLERGPIVERSGQAIVSNLPLEIAARERGTVLEMLNWAPGAVAASAVSAQGPGNYVGVAICSQHVTEVFSGFGRPGVKAEHVAAEAAREAREYLASEAAVGPHLADQLMLPLGLSAATGARSAGQTGGAFTTGPLTRHSRTHLALLEQFLGVAAQCEELAGRQWRVRLGG
ncbi:MAG: RNA 3'-terminal phosphate cyclase [Pirellulales bacterium]